MFYSHNKSISRQSPMLNSSKFVSTNCSSPQTLQFIQCDAESRNVKLKTFLDGEIPSLA